MNALPTLDDGVPDVVRGVLDAVVGRSIDGAGRLKGAVAVAEEHRAACTDDEAAIDRLIRTHVRLAGASGFVTGLGGLAAVPVALPAGLGALYVVGARMTASIAHLRGYDVASEEVRSAVAVCLVGSAASIGTKQAAIDASRRFLVASLRRVPAAPLLAINRAVGFRLVTKTGTTGVVNLSRAIPLVGGPVSSAVDAAACRGIAQYALSVFVPRAPGEETGALRSAAIGEGSVTR